MQIHKKRGLFAMAEIKDKLIKYYSRHDRSILVNAARGHFATGNSHVNYFIDITRIKIRIGEAMESARALRQKLLYHVTEVDTICCLEGTEVLGAYLGEELEKGDFYTANMHETLYVVRPEENKIHQYMFRTNTRMCIEGKSVVILVPSITSGDTILRMAECVEYYGGKVAGVAAIFSIKEEVGPYKIYYLFDDKDLPGYHASSPQDCPLCKKGIPLEALINGYGYSMLNIEK